MSASPESAPVRALQVGTSEHFRWLRGIVVAVLVLNRLDAVFTLLWVEAGLALEANEREIAERERHSSMNTIRRPSRFVNSSTSPPC